MNKIIIDNIKLSFPKFTNILRVNINFLKCVPFISSSLVGMEEKKFVTFNLKGFNYKLKIKDKDKIKNIWKKIKVNL